MTTDRDILELCRNCSNRNYDQIEKEIREQICKENTDSRDSWRVRQVVQEEGEPKAQKGGEDSPC